MRSLHQTELIRSPPAVAISVGGVNTEHRCGLEADNQLKLGRQLNGKFVRLCATQRFAASQWAGVGDGSSGSTTALSRRSKVRRQKSSWTRLRAPATRTQQNARFQPRDVFVDTKVGPIERRLDRFERRWLIQPYHLRHIEHRLRTIDFLEIANDLENGRLCSIEMQTGHRMERVAPRWRQKGDDPGGVERARRGHLNTPAFETPRLFLRPVTRGGSAGAGRAAAAASGALVPR
jgi:hypothetical protein